jgi:NADP-dependent 3-hydroxy acid dehydrogenase YdfG
MAKSFEDNVVVITGASSGVGRALARAFGAAGARVALLARNEEALQVAAGEIRLAGGDAAVYPVDVADAAAVDAVADQVVESWGRIDYWINNAMATVFSEVKDMTPEEYRRVTDVTYHGYVHGTLAALKHMRRLDTGNVIQIGSALAYRSIPLQSAYCAAKAAVRGFTDSLRTELLHENSGIKVSQMHLPAVNTPQPIRQRNKVGWLSQPVPPMYSPEAIAEHVLWAAQRMPRETLIGWPAAQVVWGQKFAPSLGDLYLARTGYDGQLTDNQLDEERSDILFAPLSGDPGASGPFTDQEQGPDWFMMLQRNARFALATGGFVVASALALTLRR